MGSADGLRQQHQSRGATRHDPAASRRLIGAEHACTAGRCGEGCGQPERTAERSLGFSAWDFAECVQLQNNIAGKKRSMIACEGEGEGDPIKTTSQ